MKTSALTILTVFMFGTFYVQDVFGASSSLFLSPAVGVFPIGVPFTVDIRVDTGGTSIGTADASIVFDPNDLAYVSMSDEGSIMNRIMVDSTTVPGKIDISGFIEHTQPAYAGNNGLLAQLTFLPLRNVATEVRFAQGAATPPLTLGASVAGLANIVGNLRSATYTLVPKEVVPGALVAGAYTDSGVEFPITSDPVAVENGWYGTSSIKFSFTIPDGISDMRTGVSKDPNAEPTTAYPIPVNSVTVPALEEGNNYFLLQFKYGDVWGAIIRHSFNVDLTPPSTIVAKETERADPADPRVSFNVTASDTPSGVVRYDMAVDGGEVSDWDGKGEYTPEELSSGEHTLAVTAYDKVGNKKTEEFTFLVKSIEPPVLTDVPERVLTGDVITVRGTTYPDSDVRVFTSFNDAEASERVVRSDGAGTFTVTLADGARAGKYTVWFQVSDERGATSPLSIKRSLEVSQPYIMLFGSVAVTYLSIIVPLLGLILLLVLVLWLGYAFVRGYRTRVQRETNEAYDVVSEEFAKLRDDLRKQIGMLERANQSRELTREEMRIFTELSKKLDYIERHIEGEINDIATHIVIPESSSPTQVEPAHVQANIASAPEPLAQAGSRHTVRLERR